MCVHSQTNKNGENALQGKTDIIQQKKINCKATGFVLCVFPVIRMTLCLSQGILK